MLGIPRRSYFRRLARMRSGESATDADSPPPVQLCAPIVATYTERWPEYGHRRIHALMMQDGHVTSPSTVLRAMRLLRRSQRRANGEPAGMTADTAANSNQIPGATVSAALGETAADPSQA
jgi:hypothetical protein